MSTLEFRLSTSSALQGKALDDFPNLHYLAVEATVDDGYEGSLSGYVTKEAAALVLAAAAMLAKLKEIAAGCCECDGTAELDGIPCTICADVRAVIVQAKGRS